MYQQPHNNSQSNDLRHISMSSSVYSPIETEFKPNYNTINEEEDEEEQIIDNTQNSQNNNYYNQQENYHQEQTNSNRSSSDDNHYGLNPDLSSQTIQTFMTANTRLPDEQQQQQYHQNSMSNYSSINTSINEIIDNDETPILQSSAKNNDKTPLVDHNGFLINENSNNNNNTYNNNNALEEPSNVSSSKFLPQRKLSNKFKRLSLKLQNTIASENSYQFMNNFHQNIEKANKSTIDTNTSTSRTSNYYKKINDKNSPTDSYSYNDSNNIEQPKSAGDNEEAEKTIIISNNDQISEISSISTTASSNQSLTSINNSANDENLNNSNSNNINTNTNFKYQLKNEFPSSYNIGGTQVSDEIPIRKDLIQTPIDEKFQIYNNSKETMSQSGGLNIIYDNNTIDNNNTTTTTNTTTPITTKTITPPTREPSKKSNTSESIEEEELSSLFIRALHPFDSSTLKSDSDASICLSFEKNDLAFVHTIDESGWGEVTLIESLQRGWIPMNYFNIAISDKSLEKDGEEDTEEDNIEFPNSHYLKPLLNACGKFLINPLSHKNRKGKYTFSIRIINSIRDGVRLLLQETDCLSRSNELVTKRTIVRKSRKSLLADWYNLMVKANEFKGTSNFNKIEILTLMIYQVTRKAISFLQIWSIESKEIIKRSNEKKLYDDLNNYPLLETPPLAKQRITEINGILYSYLGLIIGRLDLIEHNQYGCEILETIAHQIILLLRELLFISKTGSDFSSKKPEDLDQSLDNLLSLVSDLVSGVKNLVVKTLNENLTTNDEQPFGSGPNFKGERDYFYTEEGGNLLLIASKMIKSINQTIYSIRNLLELTGDFKLNSERSYPDYSKIKIEPQEFVKKCMKGIKMKTNKRVPPLTSNNNVINNNNHASVSQPYKANRYSMVRSGKTGDLSFTENGINLLQQFENSPFTVSAAEFQPFTSENGNNNNNNNQHISNNNGINSTLDLSNELVTDKNGYLIGGSFKGLVYTLTNEDSPPEHFFISTFFICFRSFANGIDLIEELITRFEINQQPQTKIDINYELKLKKRRKLIIKMFQLWMESYWNHEMDYNLLTTLINFFNEGISIYLPFDSLKLIDIGAKLSSNPLIENRNRKNKPIKQLVEKSIIISRSPSTTSLNSLTGSSSSSSSTASEFNLSRVNSNSSSIKSLPINNIENASKTTSLLSKNQIQTIEKIILTYRSILGESWCSQKYINTYKSLDLNNLLNHFTIINEQNWVLTNYRPNLLDFNGLEIAKQLTIIESTIFNSIQPEELLNQNFTNKRSHLNLSPNVRLSLLFTNCLSNYVIESILQPNLTLKERINIVKIWLKISISSLYLRNFNSLAAIITSLQSHLITKISAIWQNLSSKYIELYNYLSSIISIEKNYLNYRTKIRNLLNSNEKIPIVPYINLFISDITTTTEGIPKYIPSPKNFLNRKVINFQKFSKIIKIIGDLQKLQIPYNSSDVDMLDYKIENLYGLQELILLELWKINILYKNDDDRGWKLSCELNNK
ncbi:BUD5 [Candida pseudojiufengensis]|uniref:BUD5 n=1 Tax=Candida pseudojiufengensis TaxID=497109 RepID=UPI0022249040|nr:BUD5 [Candida pseudojiufengensis]KAI5962619.1 BUD5 [Candida pseudojiufengensis]